MSPLLGVWLLGLAGALVLATLVWVWQLRSGNAGIVDAFWPLMVAGQGLGYAVCLPGALSTIVAAMALVWGLRLGVFLALRNAGHAEDRRYAALRQRWGAAAAPRMLLFFWLQGLIAAILALSLLVPAASGHWPAPPLLWLAGLLWCIGVGGEALADAQLARFKADPALRGGVCDRGLWRYSRHPNYFFEWVHWLSYVPLGLGAPHWPLALTGAAVILLVLLKLSGIPGIEDGGVQQRRPGYEDYRRRTSAFIPLPPRARGPQP